MVTTFPALNLERIEDEMSAQHNKRGKWRLTEHVYQSRSIHASLGFHMRKSVMRLMLSFRSGREKEMRTDSNGMAEIVRIQHPFEVTFSPKVETNLVQALLE